MLAKTEVIALVAVSLNDDNQVSQALAIGQLAKHHYKQLVPACEVLHIAVAAVLGYDSMEFVVVEKLNQLCENIFVLVHLQVVSCKDTISNRRAQKTSANN